MTSSLFAIAIAAVLALKTWQWVKARQSNKGFESIVGNHPDRPLKVQRFDEMEDHLQDHRCPCGGKWMMRSEGSKSTQTMRLRVIHAECTRCEEERDFFFDLSSMLN